MAKDKSVEIRRIVNRKCSARGIPSTGIFELTPRCNLRCKMCYVRLTPTQMAPIGKELTAAQWLSLAREARDAGLMFLLLTGGEPTLRADFCQIYEELARMGFSISINTNGTLFTPELRALWHRLPPSMVNVTLYGTSRADYGNLCGDPDAFDRVVDGLNWLKSEGILIHLNTTIAPQNSHRWLELEEFAKDMELELRMTAYCFPPVRREECGDCEDFSRIPPERAAELIVRDLLYQNGAESLRKRAASLSAPPQEDCGFEIGELMQCTAGRSQFWMTWDGRMTPCGMLPEPVVRPLEKGFSAAWKELHQAVQTIRLCPECVGCPEKKTCMNCAAVTYTETGSFSGKPEYMCRLNEAYREWLKKLLDE